MCELIASASLAAARARAVNDLPWATGDCNVPPTLEDEDLQQHLLGPVYTAAVRVDWNYNTGFRPPQRTVITSKRAQYIQ